MLSAKRAVRRSSVLSDVDTPKVKPGWVLIKVRAFGLNRSEWFTRRGESPSVKFPRVLGIECVGEVADSLSPKLKKGQKVTAIMGGMGRDFDGSYAEYVLAPEKIVFTVQTQLDWKIFGAIQELRRLVRPIGYFFRRLSKRV